MARGVEIAEVGKRWSSTYNGKRWGCWGGSNDGLVANLSAAWWRWIAEVNLLRGVVDLRGREVVDFGWLCLGLVCVDMSTVYMNIGWGVKIWFGGG